MNACANPLPRSVPSAKQKAHPSSSYSGATPAIGNSPVYSLFFFLVGPNSTGYHHTDTEVLCNELKSDLTLITVAHRLQTIIDADKVVRGPSVYRDYLEHATLLEMMKGAWSHPKSTSTHYRPL